jgi:hypothetical protein
MKMDALDNKGNGILGFICSLTELLTMAIIICGTVFLTVIFEITIAENSHYKGYIAAIFPLLAEALTSWLVLYQLYLCQSNSNKWPSQKKDIPFLSLVGGSAAALLVLESALKCKKFSEQIGEIKMLQELYFVGNIGLIILVIALTKYQKVRSKN